MGSLIGKVAALFAYLCVATLIAQASALVYLRTSGKLDDHKITRVSEVLRGIEPPPAPAEKKADDEDPSLAEQPSLDERQSASDLAARNLEVREQSVKSGLERMMYEKNSLTEEKDRYEVIKSNFEEQLASLREGALSSGRESVRMIWENIKPKQAKEQILRMLEKNELNEVVTILTAMPITKRAKIVSEFKTPEEAEKLDGILRLVREGVPEIDLIDDTGEQVKPKAATKPSTR